MKSLFQQTTGLRMTLFALFAGVLLFFTGCKKWTDPPSMALITVADGLQNPMGIDVDHLGNIWVTRGETFNNDGQVWVIKPNGRKYKAVINLSAFKNKQSNEPQGTSHILLDNGTLNVLSGDYLYQIDISRFKPGDPPINASKLPKEDIGSWVYSYPFKNNAHDSHIYNMCKGPGGDLYIADAGANAIIHRKGPGQYSILAEIPGFKNPGPVGPPQIQSVPTGLYYDGQDFFVTTLTGFPFPAGGASIFKVTKTGKVSVHKKGFTTLVDLAEGTLGSLIAVQYGTFQNGFVANTGKLICINGASASTLVSGLNMPVAIKKYDSNAWYITCMGDGTVKKAYYH